MMTLEHIKKEHIVLLWNAYVLDHQNEFDKLALIRNFDLSTLVYHQEDYQYNWEDDNTLNRIENGDWYLATDNSDVKACLPFNLNGKIIQNNKIDDIDDSFLDYLINYDMTDNLTDEQVFAFYESRCIHYAIQQIENNDIHPITCRFVASQIEDDRAKGMAVIGLTVRLEGLLFLNGYCDEAVYYVGVPATALVQNIQNNELVVNPHTIELTSDTTLQYATRKFRYMEDFPTGRVGSMYGASFYDGEPSWEYFSTIPAWNYVGHTEQNLLDEHNQNQFNRDLTIQLNHFALNYINDEHLNNGLENGPAWYIQDSDTIFTNSEPKSLSDLLQQQKEMIQEIKTQNQPRPSQHMKL